MTDEKSNFKTDQNYSFDIRAAYNLFIKEIDDIRSCSNIIGPNGNNLFKEINQTNYNSIVSKLKIEQTPQESRAHAFYRLIGFPVVNKDKTAFYNPGFDNIQGTKKITIDKKIKIINNPIDKFYDLSNKREKFENDYKSIFYSSDTIDSQVLALSTVNVREFSAPLQKNSSDPFDMDIKNQTYTLDTFVNVGKNKVNLLFLVNGSLKPPTKLKLERSHILKPFIVDPRIELSVSQANKRVCVPFPFDNSQTKINEINYAKRCLIEKVIRDRLAFNLNSGAKDEQINQYIINNFGVTNQQLINSLSENIYNFSDQQRFFNFLNHIRAILSKLVEFQKTIFTAQSNYYWLPIVKNGSLEKECSSNGIISFGDSHKELQTEKDRDLLYAILNYNKSLVSLEASETLNDAQTPADPLNFAFSSFTSSLSFIVNNNASTSKDSDGKTAVLDNSRQNLEELNTKRDNILQAACEALSGIEIITGEMSGLGLIDIVSIIAALYLMPLNSLLGFLDDDAFDRMKVILNNNFIQTDTLTNSYNEFNKTLLSIFNLADKLYKDLSKKSGLE